MNHIAVYAQCGLRLRSEVPLDLPEVEGDALFTADYGYHEADLTGKSALEGLLKQIDDVTYVGGAGGSVRVGGRKHLGRAYRGIGAEEVAALWQAEQKLRKDWDAVVEAPWNAFKRRWEGKTYRTEYERIQLEAQLELEKKELLAQIEKCEAWLREHPNDAELALTLGVLCLRQKLWGKAQRYLEQALSDATDADNVREAHLKLAQLHEAESLADLRVPKSSHPEAP